MKAAISVLLIFYVTQSFAQADPPAMAMPDEKNKVLVDSIIKVTNYEAYFTEYCLKKINQTAAAQNWPTKRKEEIIKSIKFEYFNSTLYNQYAFHSKEELLEIIALFNKLNKSKVQKLILTSDMIEGNLDIFVESLVAGKYVM